MKTLRFIKALGVGIAVAAIASGCDRGASIGAVPPAAAIDASFSHHKVFKYTGSSQTFEVPADVTAVKIVAMGASGDGSAGFDASGASMGGNGGKLTATIVVTPQEALAIYVGGEGGSGGVGNSGGFNGGAPGGGTSGSGGLGGGGGGASDVREGGDKLRDRIVVAGGGGGGGGPSVFYGIGNGGAGGGAIGASGTGYCYARGASGCGGSGGTQHAGGTGGAGGDRLSSLPGNPGENGTRGNGGAGGAAEASHAGGGGGGGGGGYYGGGGGGSGSQSTSGGGGGGGGGGGSSFAERHATHVKDVQGGAPAGNGQIVIYW